MTSEKWTPEEETQLAKYLSNRVCDRASGRSEDECLRNSPRDVYFIGNLRPRPEITESADNNNEFINKLAPVAFGAEFSLQSESDELKIIVTVSWDCYYRVFPTLEQQQAYLQIQQPVENENNTNNAIDTNIDLNIKATEVDNPTALAESASPSETEQLTLFEEPDEKDDYTIKAEKEQEEQLAESESPEVAESNNDRRRRRQSTDMLCPRFRKISCEATGEILLQHSDGKWEANDSHLQTALSQETRRAQHFSINDTECVRTDSIYDKIRVSEDALASHATYNTFLQSLRTKVVPEWQWEINCTIRPNEKTHSVQVVSIEFVNTSPRQAPAASSPSRRPPDNPNIEAFLFDARASFRFQGADVQPFDLELAPRGFRYDRHLWGRGFNCAVEHRENDFSTFFTAHTPIYPQMRYVTQDNPPARFADLALLASDPLPPLREIYRSMRDYLPIWKQERETYVATNVNWESKFGEEFDKDCQQFENEFNRFLQGCQLISTNQDVKLAFQLMNETFFRLGDHPRPEKRKDSWRLFQIVFIISQIPGIVALADPNSPYINEREMVDIIYFPTGGGKTEAYLGTIVFHCFFDRLRGKTAGVTAWTRFPLRLLTLQQTQRMADAIGIAELVRREQKEPRLKGDNVDGFAVGYFVGQGGSPNEIINPTNYRFAKPKDSVNWSQAEDSMARQKWKRVITCPSCRTATVRVDLELNTVRVIHRCTNTNCAFPNGEIPIYVVDNEIYRYLPCVIVGTIDKLAGLGNQRKLSQIFGQIDGRCLQHGYYKGKCCQKECSSYKDKRLLQRRKPHGLSGPTLFVQDELHLLKESLGTFDGHYETFTQQLQREFGETMPLKIIASSATIEKFERQVEHLYGRKQDQARVFPGIGPTLRKSFYAKTLDYPQRLFVGIIPHNKTIFNAILELIEFYHREVQTLQCLQQGEQNPYGGKLAPGTSEWYELLDKYITSLTYFLANRELDSINTDLKGDVNPNLRQSDLQPLDIYQLTGDTSTDEVTKVLERLEQQATSNNVADAVLATSMVSHGVDINRLNAMIFYGMPRQNAEYIQASSRVGRAHVGIVFNCLHPARERDQSHYTYFDKFHEFLGQLVEPVAINRWAKFSISRTLPGLFMAVLLQLIANRSGESNPNSYYMLDFVKRKIDEHSLKADDFIPMLEQAYLVANGNAEGRNTFREQIRQHVQDFLRQIMGAGSQEKFVSGVINPRPMMSLRDVDEPIPIELDYEGSQWAARSGNSR